MFLKCLSLGIYSNFVSILFQKKNPKNPPSKKSYSPPPIIGKKYVTFQKISLFFLNSLLPFKKYQRHIQGGFGCQNHYLNGKLLQFVTVFWEKNPTTPKNFSSIQNMPLISADSLRSQTFNCINNFQKMHQFLNLPIPPRHTFTIYHSFTNYPTPVTHINCQHKQCKMYKKIMLYKLNQA